MASVMACMACIQREHDELDRSRLLGWQSQDMPEQNGIAASISGKTGHLKIDFLYPLILSNILSLCPQLQLLMTSRP
jgi:hypothetical protein